jgi:hypothetical protein
MPLNHGCRFAPPLLGRVVSALVIAATVAAAGRGGEASTEVTGRRGEARLGDGRPPAIGSQPVNVIKLAG